MTDNMLEDPKDQEIMRHLLENPEGLKRIDLRKKTLWAKRTFDMHLEYLIKNDYVKRLKDPNKAKNSTTILKPNISDERIEQIKHLLQHLVSLQLIYKSKLPKKTKIEVTSHALKELSFSYGELVNEYIFNKDGNVLYEIGLKILKNQLSEIKELLEKNFKPKEINHIYAESSLLSMLTFYHDNMILNFVIENTKENRSKEEIILDFSLPVIDTQIKKSFDSKYAQSHHHKLIKNIPNRFRNIDLNSENSKWYDQRLKDIDTQNIKLFNLMQNIREMPHFESILDSEKYKQKIHSTKMKSGIMDMRNIYALTEHRLVLEDMVEQIKIKHPEEFAKIKEQMDKKLKGI